MNKSDLFLLYFNFYVITYFFVIFKILSFPLIFQRRYIAPPNQAGVHLKSIIGYNGNAKNSLIWQSDTGKR